MNILPKSRPSIMSEGNIYISNKIIIVGSIACLVSNISSFGQQKLPNFLRWILWSFGALVAVTGLIQIFNNPIIFIFGALIFAAGFIFSNKYGVLIESNSGTHRFIVSPDKAFIDRIVYGLYTATNSGFNDREMTIYNIETATITNGDIYKNISGSQIFVRNKVNTEGK
ncbi:MAG: DUF6232 family protein [Desulfovibrionaceae bacterium]